MVKAAAKPRSAKKKMIAEDDDSGLGVAQIVITAATPMDEVNRPFPGVEESAQDNNKKSDSQNPAAKQQTEPKLPEDCREQVPEEKPIEDPIKVAKPLPEKIRRAESEDKSAHDDQPADSGPHPASSSASEVDSNSSTAENSQCLPVTKSEPTVVPLSPETQQIEEKSEDNDDEDDVSQDIVPPSKMLIGGRASIPEELQPDQLQKLQSLKESNA